MPFVIPQRPSAEARTRNQNISNPTATQAFGVLSTDGNQVDEALHYRGGRCLTDTAALIERYKAAPGFEKLSGKWFFGGILFTHFGHFLTETPHRLRRYLDNPNIYDGIIFLKSPHAGTFSYDPLKIDYIDTIFTEYFNVPRGRILATDEYLDVEALECFPQQQQLGTPPSREYLNFLSELEQKFFHGHTDLETHDKLFLSRKSYLHAGRTLGMRAIESIYSNNGYQILSPEDFSVQHQLRLISAASKIVCEAGSALHLLDILGAQESELSVLSRRGFDAHYWRNLYGSRVSKFTSFDKALPMHHYFGTPPGAGHSLYHVQFLISFMKESGLDFDQNRFVSELRHSVSADIEKLKIGFT